MATKPTLSKAILKLMEERGLNQRQVAAIVGVHPSELSKIKAGGREWTTQQLITLAQFLGVRLGVLLLIAMDGIDADCEADRQFGRLIKSLIAETRAKLTNPAGPNSTDKAA